MRYKFKDTQGTILTSGNQLDLNIKVDIENQTMHITNGITSVVADIASKDKFILEFFPE